MGQGTRATRTRGYLVEALVGLLEEKSIFKVQVRELCQRAQVNRTTFYKHYDNVEDFVDKVVDAFLADMDANFGGANIFDGLLGDEAQATYERCVSFMTEHRAFVVAMTGPNGTPLLRERICDHWAAMFADAVRKEGIDLGGKAEPEVLAAFVVSAMWTLLEYTMRSSDTYAPAYMARQFSFLLHDCLFQALRA